MAVEDGSQTAQKLDAWFLSLLACPACPQHLGLTFRESDSVLVCGCGKYAFPVRDGIPILLVDEATVLDENASPEAAADPAAQAG